MTEQDKDNNLFKRQGNAKHEMCLRSWSRSSNDTSDDKSCANIKKTDKKCT